MEPVLELKVLYQTVLLYPDKVILRPGKIRKMSGIQEKEILFGDIQDVFLKENDVSSQGFMHFSIRGEADQSPPSPSRAVNDENTFAFGRSKNLEARQIKKYIDDRRKNPQSVLGSEGCKAVDSLRNVKPPTPCNSEDFDQYRKLTTERDWSGIVQFNNLTNTMSGVDKELKVLHQYIQENEVAFALLDSMMLQTTTSSASNIGASTWLCVLTDRRILMLDHALLSASVDTQSIRHDRIQAIASSQGWLHGKMSIDVGSRLIIIDNCDKTHVKAFARIANDWLEHISGQTTEVSGTPRENTKPDRDPIEEIKRMAQLKDDGIISKEEFAEAKASLISKM